MVQSKPGNPAANPQYYEWHDTAMPGNPKLTLSIPWVTLTGLLLPGTIVREPGCRWDVIAFGRGPAPMYDPRESLTKITGIVDGTATLPLLTLTNFLLTTLSLLSAVQVTAYCSTVP